MKLLAPLLLLSLTLSTAAFAQEAKSALPPAAPSAPPSQSSLPQPSPAQSSSVQSSPQRVVIQQVVTAAPTMTFFVDISDGSGKLMTDLSPDAVQARGPKPTKVTGLRPMNDADGVAYILMLDASASAISGSPQVQSALKHWIDTLGDADRVAVIAFGDEVKVKQEFTNDKSALASAVQVTSSDGHTAFFDAVNKAADLAFRRGKDLPARRVIIAVSDGRDDEPTSGLNEDSVRATLGKTGVQLFAIDAGDTRRRACSNFLIALATGTGGQCVRLTGNDAQAAIDEIQATIKHVLVLDAECPACVVSETYPYQVMAGVEPQAQQSPLHDVTMEAPPRPPPPPPLPLWVWIAVGAVVLLVLGGLATWLLWPKKRPVSVRPDTWSEPAPMVSPPAGGPPINARLELYEIGKRSSPHEAALGDRVVLGRDESCQIVIRGDPHVAGEQCEFTWEGGHVVVTNLSPDMPMQVAGSQLIGSRRIPSNEQLQVGSIPMRLIIIPAEQA